MGLLTGILMLPLAPVRGVGWVTEVLAEEADRELAATHSVERGLADLETARATGEITPEEADAIEAELIERMLAERGPGGGG